MYSVRKIMKATLVRVINGKLYPIDEKILVIQKGVSKFPIVYMDVLIPELEYIFKPSKEMGKEEIYISETHDILEECTELERAFGVISIRRLVEIYNQINLPEYRTTLNQVKIKKIGGKYGDLP